MKYHKLASLKIFAKNEFNFFLCKISNDKLVDYSPIINGVLDPDEAN